jgi:alpha-beta hydrolase superfamily lysophospholipase
MISQQAQFLTVEEGKTSRRIAYRHAPPARPGDAGVFWLIGLKSDMESTKAEALARWTEERGFGCTRFDYSGHGESEGDFDNGTIGAWLDEAAAVFTRVTEGPQIIAGSSTGGHVALLLLRRLMEQDPDAARRVRGLVLIAPAWDLTEELMWKTYPEEVRREIMEKGKWVQPSDYDPAGYTITRRFIEEGRQHLFARTPWNPGRPISILQGLQDTSVPPQHARDLVSFLEGGWASLTEVPDGEHRLSRPEDLALMFGMIEAQIARIDGNG